MFDFISRMLSGEGDTNPSSKRTITFLAFILCGVGYIAEIFFDKHINPATYDNMMYIVLAGLGFVVAEKFAPKPGTDKK